MIGLFNMGSLLLGIIAWLLPVISILRYEKRSKPWITLSIISLSACSISLFLQIFSIYERVKAEDWTALMDTISLLATVPAILLIGTILLNAITFYMYQIKAAKG